MTIAAYCNREVVTVGLADSVIEAARLMRDRHVGCVIATADTTTGSVPLGILTDRDIVVAVLALNLDPEEVSVGDVMSPEPHTIGIGDARSDALEMMRAKGVRRLPVVDAEGRLVAIVSADDLLGVLADEVSSLARLVSREQRRERAVRRIPT
jgi:CBS domain-containing protein